MLHLNIHGRIYIFLPFTASSSGKLRRQTERERNDTVTTRSCTYTTYLIILFTPRGVNKVTTGSNMVLSSTTAVINVEQQLKGRAQGQVNFSGLKKKSLRESVHD